MLQILEMSGIAAYIMSQGKTDPVTGESFSHPSDLLKETEPDQAPAVRSGKHLKPWEENNYGKARCTSEAS
jgi:hypothetical protein